MTIDQLRSQRASGFRSLRFEPGLETRYRQIRDEGIRERARPVSAAALLLFLLYTLLDSLMLPPAVAQDTMAVRLVITCPVIALIWWLAGSNLRATLFVRLYSGAYLVGGLSVVGIISIARAADHPLPYEGILLMLMFGYFVMGIPFRTVSVISATVILAYLLVEATTGMSSRQLMVNGFFIVTANVVGMVGSWLSEHRQRAHFLDRQMLEASRSQAEQENQRKTRLITVASHDLRQPLNIISLILENLTTDGLPEQQTRLVLRLKRSVTHFNSMLSSVLDISRLQEGMITPEPRQLAARDVLEQLSDTCLEQAQRQETELVVARPEESAGVMADPQLLHRILQNLVVNALDHSGASRIAISATCDEHSLTFNVEDNGKGIERAALGKIFEPFYRNSSHDDPGLGLGLAIVQELTGMMGGHCRVSSHPGLGASFKVTLPAARLMAVPPGPEARSEEYDPRDHCLVVVEDHQEARHWVCQTLASWGYQVRGFATAEQAVAHWPALPRTILVSDVHLPTMSGRELYGTLSEAQPIGGGILITADTACSQGYDPAQRLWVLHKPLIPMRLRAALTQLTRSDH